MITGKRTVGKWLVLGCVGGALLVYGEGALGDDEKTLPPGIVPKRDPKTFVEAVGKINAAPAFFVALAEQPDHGPTINLNLLRRRSSASVGTSSSTARRSPAFRGSSK